MYNIDWELGQYGRWVTCSFIQSVRAVYANSMFAAISKHIRSTLYKHLHGAIEIWIYIILVLAIKLTLIVNFEEKNNIYQNWNKKCLKKYEHEIWTLC